MAVDTWIVLEERTAEGGWRRVSAECTQVTQAYCAMASLIEAAERLGLTPADDVDPETWSVVSYYLDDLPTLPCLPLSRFRELLDAVDPDIKTPDSPPEAAKFRDEEHRTCVAEVRAIFHDDGLDPETHRVLFWYGY